MPKHDRYDKDILKQLTRIANDLDKIERRMSNNTFNLGMKLGVRMNNCKNCQYYNNVDEKCIVRRGSVPDDYIIQFVRSADKEGE